MNKVRPGEPVRGRLEARTHNTLLDVAEDYRRNRGKFFDPKAIGGDGVLPALTVSAYRDSGDGDLGEQCPCVLRFTDGADPGLQDPTQNVLGYMRRPTVYALSPTTGDEAEAIGITARAIPEGQFGPVYVQGVVLCTVNVSSTGHEYATLTNNATYLASATSGPAKILWKETASTGSQTCLVLLNGGDNKSGVYTWDAGNGLTDLIYFADIVKAPANAKDIICDVLFSYTLEDVGAYDIAALIEYPVPTPVPIYVISTRIAFAVQRTETGVAADPTNDTIIAATDYIGFIETRIIPLVTYDPIGAPYDYMQDWGTQVIVPRPYQGNIHFSTGEESTAYTYYLSYTMNTNAGVPASDNVSVGNSGIQSHILNYGTNATEKIISGDLLIANATDL